MSKKPEVFSILFLIFPVKNSGQAVFFLAEYFVLQNKTYHVNHVNPVKTIVACPRWNLWFNNYFIDIPNIILSDYL